tara:strand:+ start:2539 stop:2733 length:195 start_codon:yes stop_codon:yes gene_type:complete
MLDGIKQYFSDEKLKKKRISICGHCEHKKEKWLALFNEDSCGICKCSIPKKTSIRTASCPLKKW